MMITPRPYQGLADLHKIQQLLRDTSAEIPHSAMHPGDVEWWIYYNPIGEPPEQSVYLWEDEDGNLLGWVQTMLGFVEGDIFVHPRARGTALEEQMVEWLEEFLSPQINMEHPNVEIGSIFANHTSLIDVFQRHGYSLANYLIYFWQDLSGDFAPQLPEGFRFLDAMRVEYVAQRCDVHKSAFVTSRMTPDYYRDFMTRAPMYRPDHDIVVVAPNGEFVSFAITWHDPVSQRGEFEPVGTRSTSQRQGLGRATMLEGLRRMQANGMTQATVCTGADQPNNIAFYQNCGFTHMNTTLRASKKWGA